MTQTLVNIKALHYALVCAEKKGYRDYLKGVHFGTRTEDKCCLPEYTATDGTRLVCIQPNEDDVHLWAEELEVGFTLAEGIIIPADVCKSLKTYLTKEKRSEWAILTIEEDKYVISREAQHTTDGFTVTFPKHNLRFPNYGQLFWTDEEEDSATLVTFNAAFLTDIHKLAKVYAPSKSLAVKLGFKSETHPTKVTMVNLDQDTCTLLMMPMRG